MKPLATLLIAITPLVAHADKTFTKGKGGTWDCNKDPVVDINHGKANYKLTGTCKTVNINGGQNTLSIESVESLNVTGAQNTITIGTVASVNVVGSENKITYKKATSEPADINVVGSDNKVGAAK